MVDKWDEDAAYYTTDDSDVHDQDVIIRNLLLFMNDQSVRNRYKSAIFPISTRKTFNVMPLEAGKIRVDEGRHKFVGSSGLQEYLGLDNATISSLSPYVKISKFVPLNAMSKHADGLVDFKFPLNIKDNASSFNMDVDSMLQDDARTLVGCGISSVDIKQANSNIAAAKRLHEVKIVYYFSSMKELFQNRNAEAKVGDGNGNYNKNKTQTVNYNFAELISKEAVPILAQNCSDLSKSNAHKKNGEIFLEVGYSDENSQIKDSKIKKLLKDNKKVLNLNLIKHSAEFNENGSLHVTAEYMGYVEENLNKTDIFKLLQIDKESLGYKAKKSGITLEDVIRESKVYNYERIICEQSGSNKKNLDTLKDSLRKSRKEIYAHFFDKMFADNKFSFLHIPYGAFKTRSITNASGQTKVINTFIVDPARLNEIEYAAPMYHSGLKTQTRRYLDAVKKAADAQTQQGSSITSGRPGSGVKTFSTGYVYLGVIFDILGEIIDKIKDHTGYELRHALGTFVAYCNDPITGVRSLHELPLAYFPVSLKAFADWWYSHVIRNGERSAYYMNDFVRDLLTGLVQGSFNIKTFGGSDKERTPILPAITWNMDTIQCPRYIEFQHNPKVSKIISPPIRYDKLADKLGLWDLKKGVHTEISDSDKLKAQKKSLVLITGSPPPFWGFAAKGCPIMQKTFAPTIPKISAFANQGLVKSVKFKHSDAKFGKESRMVRGGMSSLEASMWGFYNATVSLYGTLGFHPGGMIYITSNAFAQSAASRIGMGGYYRILSVQHKIEQGVFNTELECQWEYQG